MLASLVIVFREVLEAGLIVGVVLAATKGVARRGRWVAGGVATGAACAVLLACFTGALAGLMQGDGQELFTATVLLIAVAMLAWHSLWMASHGRDMSRQMRAMGQAVAMGRTSLLAMAVVVAVAVLREGAEVVLFLWGVAVATRAGAPSLLAGGALGLGGGALVSWLLYRGLVAMPLRHLFAVTGWLIALLAAGMAGQAAAILAGADLIPSWGWQLWDTSWMLSETSLPGRTLHVLVGYSDRPMGIQLAAWLAVLGMLVGAGRLVQHSKARALPSTRQRP
jgi:high-affinity iron transporter